MNNTIIAAAKIVESDFLHPFNPGNPLGYNPTTTKFALYDANDPLREILLTPTGTLSKTVPGATSLYWILDFNAAEGPKDTHWVTGPNGKPTDGDDRIFGDLGNDWAVGGTGRDQVFGGWGDDLLNVDDDLTTNGTLNNRTDTDPSYNDLAYGGAGRDVLIGNSGGDRLIDWTGEFNSYVVPYSNYGLPTVTGCSPPSIPGFLLQLSKSDGADQTLAAEHNSDPTRNGEPFGELGMVLQSDAAWQAQNGGPARPAGRQSAEQGRHHRLGPADPAGRGRIRARRDECRDCAHRQRAGAIVAEAKQLWANALGAGDPRLTILNSVDVEVGNLLDGIVGETTGNSILIDRTASGGAGSSTRRRRTTASSRSRLSSAALAATPGSPAAGHMDVLTTVLHEMGNVMGFAEDQGQDVTGRVLQAGVRELPTGDALKVPGVAPAAATKAGAPITFATDLGIGTPVIDWTNVLNGPSDRFRGISDGDAPAWFGDFVNHLGQNETQRNPNASIRVRIPAISAGAHA